MRHFNHLLKEAVEYDRENEVIDFYASYKLTNMRGYFQLWKTDYIFWVQFLKEKDDNIYLEDSYEYQGLEKEKEIDLYFKSINEKFELEKQIPKLEISNQKSNNSKNRI